jgi:hypothetical protein
MDKSKPHNSLLILYQLHFHYTVFLPLFSTTLQITKTRSYYSKQTFITMSGQCRHLNKPVKKNPPIKAAARNFDYSFQCGTGKRGHVKEVGDPTIFPCGSIVYHDEHYRKCHECDAHRIIMDSWKTEFEHKKHYVGWIEPQELTMAGMKTVLRQMGATIDDVRRTPIGWTPFQQIEIYNDLTGEFVNTEDSFYKTFRDLPYETQERSLCPPLPYPFKSVVTKQSAAAVPLVHRAQNVKCEALEYLLGCAKTDGLLPQEYIDVVLEDYGIVPPPAKKRKRNEVCSDVVDDKDGSDEGKKPAANLEKMYSDVSGIAIGDLYYEIQEEIKDPMSLRNLQFSPRKATTRSRIMSKSSKQRVETWVKHQQVYKNEKAEAETVETDPEP